MKKNFLFLFLLSYAININAQHDAVFREYNKVYTTYPFSDPDPNPAPASPFYPYFRYDGFTNTPGKKEWKVVELENDFIKVIIMPQVGGKIWTAINKKNGEPFIYDNDAVKFRDIAMRGPWTSGGLEANFGIIGHTPGVATPVNYFCRNNSDGSVSCIIGLPDLLTQTRWNMEIRLPKDKAYFSTNVFWHNGSGLSQPYYSWMNNGEKVSGSLEYIFPGNHYIFHDGKVYSWPYNDKNNKQISIYRQNDFGGPKSYHVTGVYSKYWGVFWQKENYGMIHYAEREDKVGKKIWIWGLSRQGMIWENLLTDHSGQYTEIQSGRLYNQNAPESVLTPFKQFDFAPYNTDAWSEYWYPFQNTDGVVNADLNGVMNVVNNNGVSTILYSPVSYIHDTLKVWNNMDHLIKNTPVSLTPLQSYKQDITLQNNESINKISLAGSIINFSDSATKNLDRPLQPFSSFNWNSAYGFYLKGKYEADTRHYALAEEDIRISLSKEPAFIPSLNEMTLLQYRKMNYDSAFYYSRTALSVDTYDPEANYNYGLASLQLHKMYDAKDGFEVATITPTFRSAAYTEMAKIQIREKNFHLADAYADKSLVNNTENITGLQLKYLCARYTKNNDELEKIKTAILKMDPVNDFIRFETYFQSGSNEDKVASTSMIRDELPQQTYLDLAAWYSGLHLWDECKSVLEICPQKDDEILYWLAWLYHDEGDGEKYLEEADSGNPAMVFPFREESVSVFDWAMNKSANWKSSYYLAMIYAFHNQQQKALQLLLKGNAPADFAPYYILRSRLRGKSDSLSMEVDLSTARDIKPSEWRYGKYLAEFLLSEHKADSAVNIIAPYYFKNKDYKTGLIYIRGLMMNDQYNLAEKELEHIQVLPYEGAAAAHHYYEQTKLMLALQLVRKKKYNAALQKMADAAGWPENLGAGAPYADMIDNTLHDEIKEFVLKAKKRRTYSANEYDSLVKKVTARTGQ